MFRMIGALKDDNNTSSNIPQKTINNTQKKNTEENGPVFFL